MIIFSELLESLGIVAKPESQGSCDTTDEEINRFHAFAESLDPNNILEGFTTAICEIPRDTLPFHVDSGNCRLRDHNFSAVFSFLLAIPSELVQDAVSNPSPLGATDPIPNRSMPPFRIMRIASIGYNRKACQDFMLRLNRRAKLLEMVINTREHMKMQRHTNKVPKFIANASPFAIIGERNLEIHIENENQREKQFMPSAFVFPMPNCLNIYASSFVHAILAMQSSLSLSRRQVIGLVSIIPYCNDPYKFYVTAYRIAHLKIQDTEKYTCKKGFPCALDKNLFERNIGYFMLAEMIRRYGSTFQGCAGIMRFHDPDHKLFKQKIDEEDHSDCWFLWEDVIDCIAYRLAGLDPQAVIVADEHISEECQKIVNNPHLDLSKMPNHDDELLLEKLCTFLDGNPKILKLSPFHIEIAFKVIMLLGLLPPDLTLLKGICKRHRVSLCDVGLISEMERVTQSKETHRTLVATVDAIAKLCTDNDKPEAKFVLCRTLTISLQPPNDTGELAMMIVFPGQDLYDFEPLEDKKKKGFHRVRYLLDGETTVPLPHNFLPIPLYDPKKKQNNKVLKLAKDYFADKFRREKAASVWMPRHKSLSRDGLKIDLHSGMVYPNRFSELLFLPYRAHAEIPLRTLFDDIASYTTTQEEGRPDLLRGPSADFRSVWDASLPADTRLYAPDPPFPSSRKRPMNVVDTDSTPDLQSPKRRKLHEESLSASTTLSQNAPPNIISEDGENPGSVVINGLKFPCHMTLPMLTVTRLSTIIPSSQICTMGPAMTGIPESMYAALLATAFPLVSTIAATDPPIHITPAEEPTSITAPVVPTTEPLPISTPEVVQTPEDIESLLNMYSLTEDALADKFLDTSISKVSVNTYVLCSKVMGGLNFDSVPHYQGQCTKTNGAGVTDDQRFYWAPIGNSLQIGASTGWFLPVFGAVEDEDAIPYGLTNSGVPWCLYTWKSAAKIAATLTAIFHFVQGSDRLYEELSIRMEALKCSEFVMTSTQDITKGVTMQGKPFAHVRRVNPHDSWSTIVINVQSKLQPAPGMCVTVLLKPPVDVAARHQMMISRTSKGKKKAKKKLQRQNREASDPIGSSNQFHEPTDDGDHTEKQGQSPTQHTTDSQG